MFESTRRRTLQAVGLGGGAALAGCVSAPDDDRTVQTTANRQARQNTPTSDRVAADPTAVPDPVDWDEPREHEVTLVAREVTAEIEPGVTFDFMTFDGRIPGPMIRVRRGDTVTITVENHPDNSMPHNVDLHAVYGTGGGAEASMAAPGESASFRFRAEYPGAHIYHCAVPNLDYHISSGMFGMVLVEPEDGLPEVDHELYFGQHEVYTDAKAGSEGQHAFDMAAMRNEDPTYVLLNGGKAAITPDRYGAPTVQTGETARVFMACGGPNLTSSFHPIGNVWTEAYPQGAIASEPLRHVQTQSVPPGSCFVGTMEFPVPETIKLVDHALSRVARKGLLGVIQVEGEERPEIFDPEPATA